MAYLGHSKFNYGARERVCFLANLVVVWIFHNKHTSSILECICFWFFVFCKSFSSHFKFDTLIFESTVMCKHLEPPINTLSFASTLHVWCFGLFGFIRNCLCGRRFAIVKEGKSGGWGMQIKQELGWKSEARVLWTDESKCEIFGSNDVQRRSGKRYKS